MTTRSSSWLSVLWACALVLCVGYSTLAQDPPVKVELTPATVDLPAKGEVQTQLVLRNKSPNELQNIKLSWFSGTGALIKADEATDLAKLGAQADTYWTLHLNQGPEGLVPGNVFFRITYNATSPKGAAQALYATLVVNSRQTDEISKVVEIVPQTASTQLNEQRPGKIFLVVTNKSNLPIRLGPVTTTGPGFINGTTEEAFAEQAKKGFQIEARDSVSVPIQIAVTNAVVPGKHLLVFQVPVEWGASDHLQRANVIAKQEFEVGILGESELLTALGLPSFLILPGFLMIITYQVLRKGKVGDESTFKNATNPVLWIGAITLSGAMAYIYPYITRWQWLGGVSRNYLIGYGLNDVIRVWVVSIGIGVVVCAVVWSFNQVVGFLRRILFVPAPTDTPSKLLKKLFFQGLNVSLFRLVVKVGGADRNLFLIEQRRSNQETFWVGPPIIIRWTDAATPEFKLQVEKKMANDANAYSLARMIDKGERDKMLTVAWDQATTGLNGPREVKKAEVTSDPQTKNVIAMQE